MKMLSPGLPRLSSVPSRRLLIYMNSSTKNSSLSHFNSIKNKITVHARFNSNDVKKSTLSINPLRFFSDTLYSNPNLRARISLVHVKKNSYFPETTSKSVAYWLLGSAASVFGIVVLGGLTRLTESGLSITEWKPITGTLPPLSQKDWEREFEKYRASPEFQLLHYRMTLSEFKKIYYMEWGHRLWGRAIGLSFVLPAIYFVCKRKVSFHMSIRLLSISTLIGFQGFLGWYMVKSGLGEDLFAPGSHPRVSQYRLAAHLGTAFTCFTSMLWNGLAILRTHNLLSQPEYSHALLQRLSSPSLSLFRKSVAVLSVMIFTTALSGAFVAGLDAGLVYNQFPRMGDGFIPPKYEILDPSYSSKIDGTDLIWRNLFENPVTVQFSHRVLATLTFTSVLALWAYSRLHPIIRKCLPDSVRKGTLGVVHLVLLQVSLGISTLIYLVPIPLASMHQAGALALLSGITTLGSRVWIPTRSWALVKSRINHPHTNIKHMPERVQFMIKDKRIAPPCHLIKPVKAAYVFPK